MVKIWNLHNFLLNLDGYDPHLQEYKYMWKLTKDFVGAKIKPGNMPEMLTIAILQNYYKFNQIIFL